MSEAKNLNPHLGYELSIIAAKQGLLASDLAKKLGVRKSSIEKLFDNNSSYTDAFLQKTMDKLGLKTVTDISAQAQTINTKTLKGKKYFADILSKYLKRMPLGHDILEAVDEQASVILQDNREEPVSDTYILVILYKLGVKSISDLARAIHYKPGSNAENNFDKPILDPADFTKFQHAVLFLMECKNLEPSDLLPQIATRDYKRFIEQKEKGGTFGKIEQDFYQKLSNIIFKTDPYQTIKFAEEIAHARYSHYEAFPAIVKAYRQQQIPVLKERFDRVSKRNNLQQMTLDDVERRQKEALGKCFVNSAQQSPFQALDDMEAGKILITPWLVSRWLEKILARDVIPPELVAYEKRTGFSAYMHKLIFETAKYQEYRGGNFFPPLMAMPIMQPETIDARYRKKDLAI